MRYQISRAVTTAVAAFVYMAQAQSERSSCPQITQITQREKQEQPSRSQSDVGVLLDFVRRGLENGRFVFLNLCNLRNLWTT
jgi:hypothetical protein